MKKLPLGIQSFRNIVEGNYLYIDKTKEIATLISGNIYYFLSRPRRFGKSLLVSTLGEIFRGNRDLFKGLYIYDKITWKKHPVFHLDFSKITHDSSRTLTNSLLELLEIKAEEEKMDFHHYSVTRRCFLMMP